MRVVDLPCSPNAHTRKGDRRWTDASCSAMDKTHDPVAAWLRNLVRPGLRPNEPSNRASRHRPEAITATGSCTIASRRRRPSPSCGDEASELGGTIESRCSSKRALGDQSALAPKKQRANLEGAFQRSPSRWGADRTAARRWIGRSSSSLPRFLFKTVRPKLRNPFQFQRHHCL